jgi:hypothetical protein
MLRVIIIASIISAVAHIMASGILILYSRLISIDRLLIAIFTSIILKLLFRKFIINASSMLLFSIPTNTSIQVIILMYLLVYKLNSFAAFSFLLRYSINASLG